MNRADIYIAGIYRKMEELDDEIYMMEYGIKENDKTVYEDYDFLKKELAKVQGLGEQDCIPLTIIDHRQNLK